MKNLLKAIPLVASSVFFAVGGHAASLIEGSLALNPPLDAALGMPRDMQAMYEASPDWVKYEGEWYHLGPNGEIGKAVLEPWPMTKILKPGDPEFLMHQDLRKTLEEEGARKQGKGGQDPKQAPAGPIARDGATGPRSDLTGIAREKKPRQALQERLDPSALAGVLVNESCAISKDSDLCSGAQESQEPPLKKTPAVETVSVGEDGISGGEGSFDTLPRGVERMNRLFDKTKNQLNESPKISEEDSLAPRGMIIRTNSE